MTMVDTLYDAHYRQPREARVGVRGDPERGGPRDRSRRRRRDPVRRAGVQRLFRRGARLGHRGARARRAGLAVQDGRPHLLRLRHQGEHRVEEDAGRRNGGSTSRRSRCSRASAIGAGIARMRELARADRPDRAARRQGRAGRRDRRRDRPRRDAGGGRRRHPQRAALRSAPSGSTPAPTAAWCRWRGRWPAASSARWARGRRRSAPNLAADLWRAAWPRGAAPPRAIIRTPVYSERLLTARALRRAPQFAIGQNSRIVPRVFCSKQ